MSQSLNQVNLIGRVGADPDVKFLQDGTRVTRFSLATDVPVKNETSGEWENKTDWHKIACFNKFVETAGEYVKKGTLLFIEGRIRNHSWIDSKSGEKRYGTEIVVDKRLILLSSKQQAAADLTPTPSDSDVPPATPEEEEDLPF